MCGENSQTSHMGEMKPVTYLHITSSWLSTLVVVMLCLTFGMTGELSPPVHCSNPHTALL